MLSIAAALGACGEQDTSYPFSPKPNLAADTASITTPLIPKPAKLRLTPGPDTLNTLDFFALGGCALQATIGKYQSRLGRGASDSQRLLLDLEYLQLAPDCIERKRHQDQVKLAAFLTEAHQQKRAQLPATIFNATLANTEFHQLWRKPGRHKRHPGQQALTLSAIRAINTLIRRWLSGDYRANNIEFEIYLSEIAKGNGGLVRGSERELHRRVSRLEQQIHTVLPSRYREWQEKRSAYFTRLVPPTKLD